MLILFLFITCIVSGMINAIAGGGIFVVFPVLLALGLPPITANATSNFGSAPGALSSAYNYRGYLKTLPKRYLLLLLPCLIGGAIGCYLLTHTDKTQFNHIVPWLVLGAVLLFAIQTIIGQRFDTHLRTKRSVPILVVMVILFPAAIYGGYFGAGFGFVLLAFLGFTALTNIHQMNGLKNIASATVTILCIIYFSLGGLIDWRFVPFMVVGNLLGGYFGSRLAQKIRPEVVRIGIIAFGLFVAITLFIRFYG